MKGKVVIKIQHAAVASAWRRKANRYVYLVHEEKYKIMYDMFKTLIVACKVVFQRKRYAVFFLILIPFIAFLLYLIPVKEIPGNNIRIQAQLFETYDYVLISILSILEALLLVMFIYLFQRERKQRLSTIGQGNIGLLSGIPAFLFGTKMCPMCLFAMFGFLGSGAVLFLVQYHIWLFAFAIIVLLLSIYSVAKKINNTCIKCK